MAGMIGYHIYFPISLVSRDGSLVDYIFQAYQIINGGSHIISDHILSWVSGPPGAASGSKQGSGVHG